MDDVGSLQFEHVTRSFAQAGGDRLVAVRDVNLHLAKGEFVSVVGPSGCGKSTLLNMAAGLDMPTEGKVRIDGQLVTAPNPKVGFMLQKDLLLPWRTIVRNVEFGLETRGLSKTEMREVALGELARCKLSAFADRYPHQLSGGMRQRAALARTLAIKPEIILLDEPFSALDAQTKIVLQTNFATTLAGTGVTILLITHDLAEAVAMSDRVLVMSERPGHIIEEIVIDLPHRDNPLARRALPKASEYIARMFDLLHLEEKAA